MIIDLIRHAESELNCDRTRIGGRASWCELTLNGVDQARALGEHLATQNIHYDRVISSTAVRAQQTARHLLDALGQSPWRIESFPDLQEQSMGEWEGQIRAEVYTPSQLDVVQRDPWDFVPPGGESQRHCQQRLIDWIAKHLNPTRARLDRVAIVTHGMVIRSFLTRLLSLDRAQAVHVPVQNTSITSIRYAGENQFELLRKNDTTHLEHTSLHQLPASHAPDD